MHRRLLVLGLLVSASPVWGQEPGKVSFETYTLGNGLKVILSENHNAQVVTVDIWYHVGSRNERPGRTGFAHLFEHLMFEGSAHVKKSEHFQLIERAGGDENASTQSDHTNYYETLPSNRLNLGLWLEADRMRSLTISDSTFINQRETVKEERRLRVDNQPYGAAAVDGPQALFDPQSCFAYSHSTIGTMDDLNAAHTADVKAFFDQYYAPNNATLTVVGDFAPANAKALIQQYFGGIPRTNEPPPVTCQQVFNPGPLHQQIKDINASLPAVIQVYRIPADDHDDTPSLALIGILLGQGESSRLNQRLVRETKSAVAAQAANGAFGPRRGPSFFLAFAIANQGVSADSLDRQLSGEVIRLASDGVSEEELTKAKNAYRASTIRSRQTTMDIAEGLQYASMFLGNPDGINTDFTRYMAVTRDDVMRVARKYLIAANALTLVVAPETALSGDATP
jgi:zinc protease